MSPSNDLAGRRYLVGGASKGLGFAIAQQLVDSGAEVMITARSLDRLSAAQKTLGENAAAVAADVASEDDVAELVSKVGAAGPLDTACAESHKEWCALRQVPATVGVPPVRILVQHSRHGV